MTISRSGLTTKVICEVRVTLVKWAFWTAAHQILWLWPSYGIWLSRSRQSQGHLKVKVIWGQDHSGFKLSFGITEYKYTGSRSFKVKVIQCKGYLRSRPLKVIQVQGYSRSRSSQDHSHFEVKVILESNDNVFRFLFRSGRLAFVRMLIVTCFLNISYTLYRSFSHREVMDMVQYSMNTQLRLRQRQRLHHWARPNHLKSHQLPKDQLSFTW